MGEGFASLYASYRRRLRVEGPLLSVPGRVGLDDHHADFGILRGVAGAGHALAAAAAAEFLAPGPERMVFADPSETPAEWAQLPGHSVSGVRSVLDLSALRSSCSAACQNSSSRPSGLPACSHRRCAHSLISCSVGSDNCVSSPKARPAQGGYGGLEAGRAGQQSAARPARGFKPQSCARVPRHPRRPTRNVRRAAWHESLTSERR